MLRALLVRTPSRLASSAIAVFSATLCLCPVARAADPEGARGLLADVSRIVAGEESEGWFTDSDALREIEPAVFESTCRATPEARQEALQTLRTRSASKGDARALFATAHEMTPAVVEALDL